MGWQPGSAFFGVGLAGFMWVSPMMGIIIPQWMLPLLLSLSILLILVWPVSAAMTRLVIDPKKRLVADIRVWCFLGLVTILGVYRLPLVTTTGDISQKLEKSNAKPHIAMTPGLQMEGSQATVVVMFHNRGRDDLDKLTFKIILTVDGEKLPELIKELPILRADTNRQFFVMITQQMYDAMMAGKMTLKVLASVAYTFHGTPFTESCVTQLNASMHLFDYIDC